MSPYLRDLLMRESIEAGVYPWICLQVPDLWVKWRTSQVDPGQQVWFNKHLLPLGTHCRVVLDAPKDDLTLLVDKEKYDMLVTSLSLSLCEGDPCQQYLLTHLWPICNSLQLSSASRWAACRPTHFGWHGLSQQMIWYQWILEKAIMWKPRDMCCGLLCHLGVQIFFLKLSSIQHASIFS